jgi:ribosomal protein S18 acetylase RimI-like enzyme
MVKQMFSVFRASWELMDEVRACINDNYQIYKDIVDPIDLSEHQVDEKWAELNYSIREFYVARDKGEYIGAASFQNLENFAYIGYFYIKPPFQGQNYGRALMNFLELHAKLEKIQKICLFANNRADWAIKFYKKLGFRIISEDKQEILSFNGGILSRFYEQNAFLMEKKLG